MIHSVATPTEPFAKDSVEKPLQGRGLGAPTHTYICIYMCIYVYQHLELYILGAFPHP